VQKGGEGGVFDSLLCRVWLEGELQKRCEKSKAGEGGEGGASF